MAGNKLATALLVFLIAYTSAARAQDSCATAIVTAEQENQDLPAHILHAIGVVESGRRDPLTGQISLWPWSVNAAGDSRVFDTSGGAIAFVRDAQARGIRSIDVGCMQVNLLYHPDAFATLQDAFAPERNVRYATAFLLELHQRTGDWLTATGNYHSATPDLARDYVRRVQAVLAGTQPIIDPSTRPFPAAWSKSRFHLLPVVLTSVTAGRVQVIAPGVEIVQQRFLREAGRLPKVYHPGG
jgi:hypothetical protein